MDFQTRQRITDCFERWEQAYPVDQWMINGIHAWPLIKMRIFNDAFYRLNKTHNHQVKKSRVSQLREVVTDGLLAMLKLIGTSIKKYGAVYAGGDGHRVLDKSGTSINRYFDPLMDESSAERCLLVEYDRIRKPKFYKGERVLSVFEIFPAFLLRELVNGTKGATQLDRFSDFLTAVEKEGFATKNLRGTIQKQTIRIHAWKRLFAWILKQTQAKKAFALCYYANPMYGLLLACKEQGVSGIDMQHGTQGPLHPAYSFSKIPSAGYNIVPDVFYCWDQLSYQHIKSWSGQGRTHQPIVVGNPWNRYLVANSDKFNAAALGAEGSRIVLTLQPLQPVLSDDVLLSVIKQSSKDYKWWIRFHPRMSDIQKDEVIAKFRAYDLVDHVVFDDSNAVPLPLLLAQSKLHISRYSGSISEAAEANVKSVIIDAVGLKSYESLIQQGMAVDGVGLNDHELLALIKRMNP